MREATGKEMRPTNAGQSYWDADARGISAQENYTPFWARVHVSGIFQGLSNYQIAELTVFAAIVVIAFFAGIWLLCLLADWAWSLGFRGW